MVEDENQQRMIIDGAAGGSSIGSTAASTAVSTFASRSPQRAGSSISDQKRTAEDAPAFKRRACNPDDGSLNPRASKVPINYLQPQLVGSRQVSSKGARVCMDTCVAHYIHADGLPPRKSECPTFKAMLDKMRYQAADYKPPNWHFVAGELLVKSYML